MKELAVPFMQYFDRNDNVMKYVLWFNSYKLRYNQTRRCRYDIRVSLFILLVKNGVVKIATIAENKTFQNPLKTLHSSEHWWFSAMQATFIAIWTTKESVLMAIWTLSEFLRKGKLIFSAQILLIPLQF